MSLVQLFSTESNFLCKIDSPGSVAVESRPVLLCSAPNRCLARHFDAEKNRPKPQTCRGHPDPRFCGYLKNRILRYGRHFGWYRTRLANEFGSPCENFWNGARGGGKSRVIYGELRPSPMSWARWVASKCCLTLGCKMYGSWWDMKKLVLSPVDHRYCLSRFWHVPKPFTELLVQGILCNFLRSYFFKVWLQLWLAYTKSFFGSAFCREYKVGESVESVLFPTTKRFENEFFYNSQGSDNYNDKNKKR